jgi:hypothetical protein
VKLAKLRRPKATYFLSSLEYRPNANPSTSHIHTNMYRTYSQKWDWYRRPREEGKKGREIVNNNEVQHICVRTRHNETH